MRKLIIGNWKMNGLRADSLELVSALADQAAQIAATLVVCPPFPLIFPPPFPSPSARPLSRAVHAHVSTREWAASRRGVCARLGTAVPLSSLAPRPSCVCRGPGRFARPLLV